ncbi:MAG TPA: cation diffusion facilitator family transporter [Candidatus Acidoferrales bacterium]|nr:cation diffusion facilitator family transporter [Candidatus Acidoferrales bacterium]
MHFHQEHAADASTKHLSRRLKWATAATLGLVVVKIAGGVAGHSIALVTDGVHNLSDLPSLVISWVAVRLAERPPTSEKTFGYHRAGILAAFTNALLLVVVAAYLLWEAYQRFSHPAAVYAPALLGLGAAGLLVNGGITLALVRGRHDLNLRSVLVHNASDALSSLGILGGGLAIQLTKAHWIDPAVGIAIGAMVLWSSIDILRDSSHILLEGLPKAMRLEDIARAILAVEPVQEVHDIHVWTLGTGHHVLSCHVCIPDMHIEESEKLLERIAQRVEGEFQIRHTTIQFERSRLPAPAGLYMPAPLDSTER